MNKYRLYLIICSLLFSLSLNANIYVVTTTTDSIMGSLRSAIISANSHPNLDTIQFNIPLVNGKAEMLYNSNLNPITKPLIIDGFSQPGNTPNNINLVLSGINMPIANEAYGITISTHKCLIQGIHFKNFEQSYGAYNYPKTAIRIFPKNLFTSDLRDIKILSNSFSNSLSAIVLDINYQSPLDSLKSLIIDNNTFNDIINAIKFESSNQFPIAYVKNISIRNNSFTDCYSGIHLQFNNFQQLQNQFCLNISDNLMQVDSLILPNSSGIFFEYPYVGALTNNKPNVLIKNNAIAAQNALRIDQSPQSISTQNSIGIMEICENHFVGNQFDEGLRLAFDSKWKYAIINNEIDSFKVAIDLNAGDNYFLDLIELKIDSNILSNSSSRGIKCWISYTATRQFYLNNISITRNSILNNDYKGIEFDVGGTGDFKVLIDSVLIEDNSILDNGNSGLSFEVSGTGDLDAVFSNLHINRNLISNNGAYGLYFDTGGTSNALCRIREVDIKGNRINGNAQAGIVFISGSSSTIYAGIEEVDIHSNEIFDNGEHGIYLTAYEVCGATPRLYDFLIQNNTISNNDLEAIKIEGLGYPGSIYSMLRSINISENSIFDNLGKGILHFHQPAFQPSRPLIDTVNFSALILKYHLNGIPNTTYIIEFFSSVSMILGNEQGQEWFLSDTIYTDVNGFASNLINIPSNVLNTKISATAKIPQFGLTSEFSSYQSSNSSLGDIERSDILVYPNPTENVLYIQSDLQLHEIFIQNSLGQIVKTIKGIGWSTSVDMSNLAKGIYQMTIKTENGLRTEKILLR